MRRRGTPAAATAVALPLLAVMLGDYRGGQLAQFLVLGAAAAALAFSWGRAGILSLGHSVPFGAGAYAGAWFSLHGGGAGSVVGLVVGALCGGGIALPVAMVGLRRRIDPVTFALTTFVVALAAEQAASRWTSVTGGFNGLADIPRFHVGVAALTPEAQRGFSAFVAIAVIVLLSSLATRPYGAVLAATRDDERRTAALGYDVDAVRVGVFVLTGLLTGLLGAVYAMQTQFVAPGITGVTTATSFVVWVLLGSRGTTWGPVAVTVIYSVGVTELAGRALNYWLLVTGALFLAVVVLAPEGLAVLARRLVPWASSGRMAPRIGPASAATSAAGSRPALRVSDVGARFGSFVAVDGVDLTLDQPLVHCLIGPNGAGKSTLLDVLSGFTPHSRGSWRLGEVALTGEPPWIAARCGIGRKFQAPSIAGSLTVAENLALARWGRTHRPLALVRQQWQAELPVHSWRVVTTAGLERRLNTQAAALSHGERQMLELAMTLAAGCDVLLLDEPTAGMTARETALTAGLLRELCVEQCLPILIVEHDMAFIRDVADRVTMLRNGRVMRSGTVEDVEGDDDVRAVYLGRSERSSP